MQINTFVLTVFLEVLIVSGFAVFMIWDEGRQDHKQSKKKPIS